MRRPTFILALLAAVLANPGNTTSEETSPLGQPTYDSGADLAALCRSLTEGENAYFGRLVVEELAGRIDTLGDSDSMSAVLLRTRLGFEQIRLGNHSQAIATLEEARASSSKAGLRPEGGISLTILESLAMAHLQLAEDQNCIALHNHDSCILPIRRGAIHQRPTHTRAAAAIYQQLVSFKPDSYTWIWLLNLSQMLSGDYPQGVAEHFRLPAKSLQPELAFAAWRDVAPGLGLDSFDHGGGAIIDDFDGDGLLDIVSSSWDPCESIKAFRNRGDGSFEDVTRIWGLDGQLGSINIVQADYDGDGDLDLLALRGAWLGAEGRIRNSLLKNELDGEAQRFVDITTEAGLGSPNYPSHSGAWADFDRDGDLDLFVGNETTASSADPLSLYGSTGEAYPSQLFRNNGDGTFTDVAASAGVTNLSYAKGASWGDYDNDKYPDLYVSNIGVNHLYRNQGDGTFEDVAPEVGVESPVDSSFATWFFDFDNDGDLDLFVARYNTQPEKIFATYFEQPAPPGQPVLYRNDLASNGSRRFTAVSAEAGLEHPVLVMGANFGDLDNDGWLDLYLGTGVPDYNALMPNVMYKNINGRRFSDVTFAGGFGQLQKGHGIAFGDLDNDGDQDLYQQLGGAFPYDAYGNTLYENPTEGPSWITLRLEGGKANRFGVGARIEIVSTSQDGPRSVHHLVGSGGSFGGSSLQAEIGLGTATSIDHIEVLWPGSGLSQTFVGPELNRTYRVIEGRPEIIPVEIKRFSLSSKAGKHHSREDGSGLASQQIE